MVILSLSYCHLQKQNMHDIYICIYLSKNDNKTNDKMTIYDLFYSTSLKYSFLLPAERKNFSCRERNKPTVSQYCTIFYRIPIIPFSDALLSTQPIISSSHISLINSTTTFKGGHFKRHPYNFFTMQRTIILPYIIPLLCQSTYLNDSTSLPFL